MSRTTDNLKLFVYKPTDDGSSTFNITNSMTDNFEKIDKMLNVYAYDSTFTYSSGMFVMYNGAIYRSLVDNNTGKALNNGSYWEIVLYDNTEDVMNECVQRKSTSQATGDGTTPVYIKANGKVEICERTIEDTRFNGQFVDVNPDVVLSSTKKTGTYSIDVSGYLPDDNYKYELLLMNKIGSGGNTTQIYLSSSVITSEVQIGLVASYCDYSINTFTFPVGTDRTLTYKITNNNASGSAYLRLLGYQRIGTNN